jgi:hypothetical protein
MRRISSTGDISKADDTGKVVVADVSWTQDAAYLGEDLVADFAHKHLLR